MLGTDKSISVSDKSRNNGITRSKGPIKITIGIKAPFPTSEDSKSIKSYRSIPYRRTALNRSRVSVRRWNEDERKRKSLLVRRQRSCGLQFASFHRGTPMCTVDRPFHRAEAILEHSRLDVPFVIFLTSIAARRKQLQTWRAHAQCSAIYRYLSHLSFDDSTTRAFCRAR